MLGQLAQKNEDMQKLDSELAGTKADDDLVESKNSLLKGDLERLNDEYRDGQGVYRKNQLNIIRLRDSSKARDQDNQNDAFKCGHMADEIKRHEQEIDRLAGVLDSTKEQSVSTMRQNEQILADIGVVDSRL